MSQQTEITIIPDKLSHKVSPDLYGIFLEDLNFSCDGGLNANMVNNYSFDGVYLNKEKKKPLPDYLRFWNIKSGSMQSAEEKSLSPGSRYARITAAPGCTITNLGYNGLGTNSDRCAISIVDSSSYEIECYIRNNSFSGHITAHVEDENGKVLTSIAELQWESQEWQKSNSCLTGCSTGYGKLVLTLDGHGDIDLDCIVFMNRDFWNKDDPKWKHGKFRKDLVQVLADLNPKFIRFPGGCIVEGLGRGNEYDWKDTVGSIYERKHKFNLWAERTGTGGYTQSYQIGFYEYFCLCEDLGAKPLPTLFAGLNCQMRIKDKIAVDDPSFTSYVIQNYIDIIEFANGDPQKSRWAKLRSEMGHPAPFHLEMVGIGNENFGNDYLKKFGLIKEAIHEKYPDILCVLSSGVFPLQIITRKYWKYALKSNEEMLVDEHSYQSPKWFYQSSKRFDKYAKGKAKVYFGEYAANGIMAGKKLNDDNTNLFESALAEAAFLTGVERNSDVVAMASYAPLFNLVESRQWLHNLIDFSPSRVCLTANYMVQKLFSNNIGSQYIPYEGSLPANIYLSVTADEKNIYIKIVNAGPTSEDIAFKINGLKDQTAIAYVLQSENLMVKNRLGFHGRPEYKVDIENEQNAVVNGELNACVKRNSVNVFLVAYIPPQHPCK